MARRIVFVCTGNICRSPTAQGVLHKLATAHGLAGRVEVASAGLQDWHAGAPPDARSTEHALRRGYDIAGQRARHFTPLDFEHFDQVIAMDAGHHDQLRRLCPPRHAHKLRRAADFSDRVPAGGVPDPYYGDANEFEAVLDLIEAICQGVLAEVGPPREPPPAAGRIAGRK
ncbi:MAG: low molecular weight phosphotyrosine protein phosphatase [Burkholderiales bacterium]|nr:low molecular weight phosphotyrosine protein phosphatase [Burkholderiales bacterium]